MQDTPYIARLSLSNDGSDPRLVPRRAQKDRSQLAADPVHLERHGRLDHRSGSDRSRLLANAPASNRPLQRWPKRALQTQAATVHRSRTRKSTEHTGTATSSKAGKAVVDRFTASRSRDSVRCFLSHACGGPTV